MLVSVPLLRCYLTGKPIIRLAHRCPGRLRLIGEALACEELHRALSAHDGVTEVGFNPVTHSLLVCYEDEEGADSRIVGFITEQLPAKPARPKGPPQALRHLRKGMDQLDEAVYKSTAGWMDARLMIPTLLAAYGLKRVLVNKSFRLPAGLTMLWWSYATFWNLSRGEQRVVD